MHDLKDSQFDRVLPPCSICNMRKDCMCAMCNAQELDALQSAKSYRSVEKGQVVAFPQDELSYVGTIMSGIAVLSRLLEDGRHQNVGLLYPGDFLGRPGRKKMPFLVTALTDVEICSFEAEVFSRLLEEAPGLHARLLEMMLDELDASRDWLLVLGRKTARERICSLFLHILYKQSRTQFSDVLQAPIAFQLFMSREQMADLLGLRLETVSRQISQLRADEIVHVTSGNTVIVTDPHGLLEGAGNDADGGLWA